MRRAYAAGRSRQPATKKVAAAKLALTKANALHYKEPAKEKTAMDNKQIANYLKQAEASLKRKINGENNPLIKEILEKDIRELTEYITGLLADKKKGA